MPTLDVDGVAINYVDEGWGPAIVLVHGFASSLQGNWRQPGIFDAIIQSIREPADPWMTAADFRGFVDAQRRAEEAYRDADGWTRMSILNTACSGRFSTDRTMRDYNDDIWHLEPIRDV